MTRQTRRRFSPEYKEQAVARLLAPGATQASVAAELGVTPTQLKTWRLELEAAARPRLFPHSGRRRHEREARLHRRSQAEHAVRLMCRVAEIREIFEASRQRYGAPGFTPILQAQGDGYPSGRSPN